MLSSSPRLYGKFISYQKLKLSANCNISNVLNMLKVWDVYQFGRGIICSDSVAEAARYGFTAVDRPEGFLVLAIASLGDKVTEITSPPEVCDPSSQALE